MQQTLNEIKLDNKATLANIKTQLNDFEIENIKTLQQFLSDRYEDMNKQLNLLQEDPYKRMKEEIVTAQSSMANLKTKKKKIVTFDY